MRVYCKSILKALNGPLAAHSSGRGSRGRLCRAPSHAVTVCSVAPTPRPSPTSASYSGSPCASSIATRSSAVCTATRDGTAARGSRALARRGGSGPVAAARQPRGGPGGSGGGAPGGEVGGVGGMGKALQVGRADGGLHLHHAVEQSACGQLQPLRRGPKLARHGLHFMVDHQSHWLGLLLGSGGERASLGRAAMHTANIEALRYRKQGHLLHIDVRRLLVNPADGLGQVGGFKRRKTGKAFVG